MPIYEYRCTTHGHQFDISQPVGAPPPLCPTCGSATRKVYTSVGLIFRGPGFYVTDYRRAAGDAETKGDAEMKGDRMKDDAGKKADGGKAETTAASEAGSEAGPSEKAGGSKSAETAKA